MNKAINNVQSIFKRIEQIAPNSGVEVVAATKSRSIEEILSITNNTPIKVAGENRVQDFIAKYDDSIEWDFIGQLQTNKIKYIIDKVRLIHSVDRERLVAGIDKEAKKIGKIQDILIQINTGKEENKGGIFLENVIEFADMVNNYKNVRLRGLMAVAPLEIELEELRKCFVETRKVYEQLVENNKNIKYLSMGMSNDFELAVECGANLVRLGRIIFGERI